MDDAVWTATAVVTVVLLALLILRPAPPPPACKELDGGAFESLQSKSGALQSLDVQSARAGVLASGDVTTGSVAAEQGSIGTLAFAPAQAFGGQFTAGAVTTQALDTPLLSATTLSTASALSSSSVSTGAAASGSIAATGALSAASLTVTGLVAAVSGVVAQTLSAASATFAAVSAGAASFASFASGSLALTGGIGAGSATVSGPLSTGSLGATTSVTSASLAASSSSALGAVTGTTASLSSTVSAPSATLTTVYGTTTATSTTASATTVKLGATTLTCPAASGGVLTSSTAGTGYLFDSVVNRPQFDAVVGTLHRPYVLRSFNNSTGPQINSLQWNVAGTAMTLATLFSGVSGYQANCNLWHFKGALVLTNTVSGTPTAQAFNFWISRTPAALEYQDTSIQLQYSATSNSVIQLEFHLSNQTGEATPIPALYLNISTSSSLAGGGPAVLTGAWASAANAGQAQTPVLIGTYASTF